jgi:hypothetical protein
MIIILMRRYMLIRHDLCQSTSTPKALDRRYSLGDEKQNALVYFTKTVPYSEVVQPPIWVEMPSHTQRSDFLN